MEFIKIRASWEDYPENLYRVLLINKNLTLYELGDLLCTLFKTHFEHDFMFKGDDNCVYHNKESLSSYSSIPHIRAYDYKEKLAEDVLVDNKKLTFTYDLEEGYDFLVKKISKTIYEYPIDCKCLLLEAKGDGIFEGNLNGLLELMEGDISEDTFKANHENYDRATYNFDTKFDIDYINAELIKGTNYFKSRAKK